jgi:hypothetical protein
LLSTILFWIVVAVALTGQVAIIRAVLTGRAPAASRSAGARWAEVAWVMLPTLALIAALIHSSRLIDGL